MNCLADAVVVLSLAAALPLLAATSVISPDAIVDLTRQLKPDGTLDWKVPAGEWTIVRMGRRVTGADTRPAPQPAAGLECDKFDAKALEFHLEQYVGTLLKKIGTRAKGHGLTTLHMDSWESGAQNWTPAFLDEFRKRRGYDARTRRSQKPRSTKSSTWRCHEFANNCKRHAYIDLEGSLERIDVE